MVEYRASARRRTIKGGKILLNGGGSVLDCTVSNISKSGAMIKIENAIAVPENFDLQVDGEVRRCLAVWRLMNRIGVKFK
jgi:PilZ domain